MRLADVAVLDAEFATAGLHAREGHNLPGKITFDLGPVDTAWMNVLISFLGKLEALEAAGDVTICQRARAAVEANARAKGFVTPEGILELPGTFRAFCLAKADVEPEVSPDV